MTDYRKSVVDMLIAQKPERLPDGVHASLVGWRRRCREASDRALREMFSEMVALAKSNPKTDIPENL